MIVKLLKKSERKKYVGKIALNEGVAYRVIGIAADYFRILDEDGEPILLPAYLFDVVDDSIPATWVVEKGEEGETYANPPEFNHVGFFEDFHDGDEKTIGIFWRVLAEQQEC